MERVKWVLCLVVLATALGCKKPSPAIEPAPDAAKAPLTGLPADDAPSKVAVETPSSKVAGWLVGDVREGKWDLAYSIMAAKYRATVSRDEFERTLRTHPYFAEPKSVDVYRSGSRGNAGYVNATLEASSGSYEADYSMVFESGEWKIAGLRVGGSEVLPRFVGPTAPPGRPSRK